MPRGPCKFRQRDVTKAVRAVVAAGVQVARVEVDKDGRIVVIAGKSESNPASNPWDEAMEELRQ